MGNPGFHRSRFISDIIAPIGPTRPRADLFLVLLRSLQRVHQEPASRQSACPPGWRNDLVESWVKKVDKAKGIEESSVESANANSYTSGSYRLGVHVPGAFRRRVLLCNERKKWSLDYVTFRDDLYL